MRNRPPALLCGLVLLSCGPLLHAAANDYSDPKTWLCRPGVDGPCNADMTATVISADGKLTRETWRHNPDAPIDCFYVYPTVSTDPTANSDMTPDEAEFRAVRIQFARFGSVCRRFAPLYRQSTLPALRQRLTGVGSLAPANTGLAYGDVRDAWNYYLEHDNHGRGFVLIGHSQGSDMLRQLIRQEIDGRPIQSQLVSAILAGINIAVPKGKDVGGLFQSVPLCRAPDQTGCVVAYASFRATSPPPPNSLFGRVVQPGMEAACVAPAQLLGHPSLHAYFSASTPPHVWVRPEQKIDTPWVSLPGLLSGNCVSHEHGSYLEITLHPDPAGRRTNDIPGDLISNGMVVPMWGLHLVDVNLVLGDLIELVGRQTKAYLARH
jgi:hypothetical protein